MKFRCCRVRSFLAQSNFQEATGFLALGPLKATGFEACLACGADDNLNGFQDTPPT